MGPVVSMYMTNDSDSGFPKNTKTVGGGGGREANEERYVGKIISLKIITLTFRK